MSFSFLDAIFGKKAGTEKRRPVSLRKRHLRLEHLENRELLSVTFGDTEFADLKTQYSDVNFAQNLDHYNLIEIYAHELNQATLQAKITQAGSNTKDDLIIVHTGDSQTKEISLRSQIVIDSTATNMTMGTNMGKVLIVGYGDKDINLTITVDANSYTRALHVNAADVTLVGVKVTGGKVSTDTTTKSTAGNGGAIAQYGGSVTLAYSEVSKNFVNGKISCGGAIYTDNGSLNLIHSTISENSAVVVNGYGGAIYVTGAKANATFKNSTITNNQAYYGGGIAALNGANVSLVGTTVSWNKTNDVKNVAGKSGGGIYAKESSLSIAGNSKVISNTADASGGGIYYTKGKSDLSIVGSSVSDNNAKTTSSTGEGGAIYTDTGLNVQKSHLDGNSAGRGAAIAVLDTAKITLNVSDSYFISNQASNRGGAIELPGTGATMEISNSYFESNSAASNHGGAVFSAATLNIYGSEFVDNSAHTGGALYTTGITTISEYSSFTDNTARKGAGGAIYTTSVTTKPLTIIDTVISNNKAETTGGGVHAASKAQITGCTITENFAISDGGGILVSTDSLVSSCFVAGNKSQTEGGGIAVTGSKVKIHNSAIVGNYAVSYGGGIHGSPSEIINCTIAGNKSDKGGGGLYYGTSTGAVIKNSIIAENIALGTYGGPDIRTGTKTLQVSYSLIGNNDKGSGQVFNNYSANKINTNPKFRSFSTYTSWNKDLWESWDFQLNSDSVAVDAGHNQLVPTDIKTDVRGPGYDRIEETTKKVDMGAYEFGTTVVMEAPNVDYTLENRKVTFTWEDVKSARSYQIYRLDSNNVIVGDPLGEVSKTRRTWSESNLPDGLHRYAVIAVNGTDRSDYIPIEVWVDDEGGIPGKLMSPKITPTVVDDTVILRWQPVVGATHYEIYEISGAGNEISKGTVNNPTMSWSESGLSAGEHIYVVYACNDEPKNTSTGAQVSVTVAPPIPDTPDFSLSQDANGFVTIAVEKVFGAEKYIIARRMAGSSQWETIYEGSLPGGSHVDYTAPEGNVEYSVRAINVTGSSDFYARMIPVDKPPVATTLTIVYSEATGRVVLTWDAVPGAQGYEISRLTPDLQEPEILYSKWPGTSFSDLNPPEGDVIYMIRACEGETYSVPATDQIFIEPREVTVGQTTVTASVLENQATSIVWTKAENATEYVVYRRTANNPVWQQLTITSQTGYLDATPPLGNVDYYVAAKRGLTTTDSDLTSVTVTLSAPLVDVSAEMPGEVNVTWSEVPNATYYSVWIKVGDAAWTRIGGNFTGNEFTDDNPPSGTVKYGVKAHMGTAASKLSSGTVNVPIQLSNPVLKAVVQRGGTVSVTWNNVANASEYMVYRREVGVTDWDNIGSTASGVTSYSDSDLPFGEFEYYVEAVNTSVSSESNIVSATVSIDAPTAINAVHNSTGVSLTWDSVDRAEYYSVWIKIDNGAWTKIANKEFGTSFVANIPPAGSIRYGVRAHSGANASTTTTCDINIPLAAPSTMNGEYNTSSKTVSLSWSAVSDATSYTVWTKNASGNWVSVAGQITDMNYTVTSPPNGTVEYGVTAHKGSLTSERSEVSVEVQGSIATPVVDAVALTNGTVSLSWDAVDGAAIYMVFRCATGTGNWDSGIYVYDTYFIDSTVSAGQYDYAVIAYSASDNSGHEIVTVTVPEASHLMATANDDGSVSLTWSMVVTAGRYTIMRQDNDGGLTPIATIIDGTTTNFTDMDVPEGTYTYILRAFNGLSTIMTIESGPVHVESPPEVVTVPVLAKPTVDTDGNVNLSWTPATAAVNYIVQRRVAGGAWERIATATTAGYIDTTAPDGMVEYRVRANFGGGNVGDFSNIVKSAVNIPTQPWGTKPQLSYDLDANGYVILSWIEIEDSTRYVVQVNVDGGGWVNLVANLSIATYTDATLRTGTVQYRVRVFQDSEVVTSNPLTIV